jgi:hypothetical protein
MIIYNYSDFLLEKEMKNWEKLNEEAYWEELTDRLFKQLDKAFKVGESVFLQTVIKIFRYFKSNPKVLALVVGLLVAKFHFTKDQVMGVVPEDTIVSAEELYAQSREGKGLPEDLAEDGYYDSEETTVAKYNAPLTGNLKKFLTAIADKESSLDPEKVNTEGYMGKYQFGEIALKDILQKLPGESDEEHESRVKRYWPKNFGKIRNKKDFNFFQSRFKNKGIDFWPEQKQDLAMKQLLKNNKAYLGDYIDKWVGKKKKGINITLSGLLAGAHLLGPSNVKAFLDHGTITKDGYGTPITEYIDKFGGYKVNI